MRSDAGMMACVDVCYRESRGSAAALAFEAWEAARELETAQALVRDVAPYRPGAFFLRELPCIERVLAELRTRIEIVVVDGFCWLGAGQPGLGAHVHRALGLTVVGVAKTAFRGAEEAVEVLRGKSRRPLYVSAAGADPREAARWVERMHGPHRIPTLLGRVDRLARSGWPPS